MVLTTRREEEDGGKRGSKVRSVFRGSKGRRPETPLTRGTDLDRSGEETLLQKRLVGRISSERNRGHVTKYKVDSQIVGMSLVETEPRNDGQKL